MILFRSINTALATLGLMVVASMIAARWLMDTPLDARDLFLVIGIIGLGGVAVSVLFDTTE